MTLRSDRALLMERRIETAATERGLGGDRLALVLRAHQAAMLRREARPLPGGEHDATFLHPGRTVLILLQDAEVVDATALAVGALTESRDSALRVDPDVAAEVLGEGARLWREIPSVDWDAGAEGDPVGGAEGDAALLEALVTAPRAALRVTLAEALDHLRHAHRWESRPARVRALALARDVFGPVAGRAHPTLDRRFAWWIRRVGGNARLFGATEGPSSGAAAGADPTP